MYIILPYKWGEEKLLADNESVRKVITYAFALGRLPRLFDIGEPTPICGLKNDFWKFAGRGEPITHHNRDKWNRAFHWSEDFLQFEEDKRGAVEECMVMFPRIEENFCQVDLSVLQKIFRGVGKRFAENEKDYWKRGDWYVWNDWEGAFYVYMFIKSRMRKGSCKLYQNYIIKDVHIGKDRILKNLKWLQTVGIFSREVSVDKYGGSIFLWKELV
jgi:hypothetical protein